jgi:uncharacterized phage protein (TIGR01671 family)
MVKAKHLDKDDFVEGYLYEHEPPLTVFSNDPTEERKWYVLQTAFADWNMPRQVDFIEIDKNTISSCTGLKDKNGVYIFENDIVKMRKYGTGYMETKVYFKDGKFAVNGSNYHFKDIKSDNMEVIGWKIG